MSSSPEAAPRVRIATVPLRTPPPGDVDLTIFSSLDEARRARPACGGSAVLVAGASLPFRDGALGAVEDWRARSLQDVEEDTRALRSGGLLRVVSGSRAGRRFWRPRQRPVLASEWSAWFLGAGLAEITQRELDAPTSGVSTEGVVRKLPTVPG
ncbi:MAG: hypothetical protein HYY06_06355 [Deltaproteobacteria bacterium]|nr:hypothetical protein [Deltaproteobacteria bacterium]